MVAAELAKKAERIGVTAVYHRREEANMECRLARRAYGPLALALALLLPGAAAAQVPDTLTFDVEGWGVVHGIAHQCPISENGKMDAYVGIPVTCPVWVVDADGERTPGRIVAEADSTFVSIVIQGDSLMTVTVLRKGNTHVRLYPVPILQILAYYPATNTMDTEDPLTIRASWDPATGEKLWQEETRLCGYVQGFAAPLAKTDEGCPDLGHPTLPIFHVTWTVTDETATPQIVEPLRPMPLIAAVEWLGRALLKKE